MNDDTLIRGLIDGDEDAISQFAECENCVVTDWRDGAEEILTATTAFLPKAYLVFDGSENEWRVTAGGRPSVSVVFIPQKQEPFFVQLNRILSPDFAMYRYRPADGDGYSLYLKPKSWWDSFKIQNPEIFDQYFESVESLAEYSAKSFFGRLFSKR